MADLLRAGASRVEEAAYPIPGRLGNALVLDILSGLDIAAYLRAIGLGHADLAAVRASGRATCRRIAGGAPCRPRPRPASRSFSGSSRTWSNRLWCAPELPG